MADGEGVPVLAIPVLATSIHLSNGDSSLACGSRQVWLDPVQLCEKVPGKR